MYSVENTWKEVRDSGVDTAVVAFGSIEQHGHHLPLGTDWMIADAEARALAEKLNAFVLPAMPFGNSREHMAFPGTITLRPATLGAVLEDIVESLRSHGIRKIVVLSSHGGNWILKPTMRELNFKYPDIMIVHSNGIVPERGDEPPGEIHAGKDETSAILHIRPDLVKGEDARLDSPGRVGQEFNDYVGYDRTTRAGAWGFPSGGDATLGRERFQETVERQAEYVSYVFNKVAELKRAASVAGDK
jgi:creatinine amidohydrolase